MASRYLCRQNQALWIVMTLNLISDFGKTPHLNTHRRMVRNEGKPKGKY